MIIKLMASDLDGTLLQNGSRTVSEEALKMIEELQKRDVIFAAASGRQYSSLRRLFAPVADKMMYICENGALVMYKGEVLSKSPIDRELGISIMKDIQDTGECEILLSGEDTSYLIPKDSEYARHIEIDVMNNIKIINDFDEVPEDFIKISVYNKSGIDKHSDYFINKWGDKVKAVISGERWLDFTSLEVNKGVAISSIKKKMDIGFEETMVFGDNYNDIEMFSEAFFSYAMTSAVSEIRASARYVTPSVESIMFDVLKMIGK